jgi:uncharacterized membrane protein
MQRQIPLRLNAGAPDTRGGIIGLVLSAAIVVAALRWQPLSAPSMPALALWTHVFTALLALVLGGIVLYRPKGTASHKLMGRVWVASMAVTSITSFFIQTSGRLSYIHFLSAWTLWTLAAAMWHIRRGNVIAHKRYLKGAYIGLIVAGVLAVALPGRVLWRLVMA